MKPGIRTTEFWLALAGLSLGTLLVLWGEREIGGTLLAASSVASYATSRGLAKRERT